MRNKTTKITTFSTRLRKCSHKFIAHNKVMLEYGKQLDLKETIITIKCNEVITLSDGNTNYTTDIVAEKTDGTLLVRECVTREELIQMRVAKLLDESRNYWLKHDVQDWGIVINE